MMTKTRHRPTRADQKSTREASTSLAGIRLTDEERQLFDEAFVAQTIAAAMAAVKALQARRESRISNLLAMRDMLFAEWLRDHVGKKIHEHDPGENEPPVLVVPDIAVAYERVTRFAAKHDLAVADYLRFVEAFKSLNEPISNSTTDEELSRLFDLIGAPIT